MSEPKPKSESSRGARRSAPLAACGAVLALLSVVALGRGYEREPPSADRAASGEATAPLVRRDEEPASHAPEVRRLLEGQRLDVNRATVEELQLLPRIGPTLAARIIEERERGGPFRTLHDLTRVRGIGPRTVERLAPLAEVGDVPAAPP